jgi:hypothetical protein
MNKIIKTKNGYQLVSLTLEESQAILKAVKKMNTAILQDCLKTAKELLKNTTQDSDAIVQTACALFRKLGVSTYTVLRGALDEKTHRLKNGQG